MQSPDSSVVLLKLHQFILDSDDVHALVTNLLPYFLLQLSSVGLTYHFSVAILIDQTGRIQQNYLAESVNLAQKSQRIQDVISLEDLFSKGGKWEREILWGKAAVSSEISTLVNHAYQEKYPIKSVVVCPIKSAQKVSGILILGSLRSADQIKPEELLLVEQITNLLAIAYKLQDTQSSLTNITQEVYKMNAKLHELDKLKDDFVSVASHELRTPMTAIRSYAWMALYRPDMPLTQKMKKYLDRVLVSTERLINLVNDLLNISRIESGRIEIRPEAFDIQVLVADALAEVEAKAKEKNVRLLVRSTSVPKVFADKDKIHQVILNLLGNSLKFTPPEGSITISYFADGKMLDVSVQDTGVGISKEDVGRLFQKFGRLDNSYVAAATSGGTGLGLFICRNLVELMHGKIWAASEGVNKGSTFTFSLPIATPEVLSNANLYSQHVTGEVKQLEPVAI